MRGSEGWISDLKPGVAGGSAENVIEAEFEALLLVVMGNRGSADCGGDAVIGVGGACAM